MVGSKSMDREGIPEHEKRGNQNRGHSHGQSSVLDAASVGILRRGLGRLLSIAEQLSFGVLPSERHPT